MTGAFDNVWHACVAGTGTAADLIVFRYASSTRSKRGRPNLNLPRKKATNSGN